MIGYLLIPLLLAQPAAECPALLVLKGYGVSSRAQAYADCMSRPWLPLAADFAGKKRQCAVADPSIGRAVAWVDHIASNHPGCETRLEFKRK